MKKLRLFQDKRKLKIFAIRAMIYLIIIAAIVLLSSIIGRADYSVSYVADKLWRYSNATITPMDNHSAFSQLEYDPGYISLSLNDDFIGRYSAYFSITVNSNTPISSISFNPSQYLTVGTVYVMMKFLGYVVDDEIIQVPTVTNSYNPGDSYTFTFDNPITCTNMIFSVASWPNNSSHHFTSMPVADVYYTGSPPAPAPDEWQTLIEFIGYLIDSVVNVFNLTFSIESKLVWALVFGFPILNFVLDFFDDILDQIDASLPADHDLHKYRPAGYQAPNYYDYHFDYDYWIHNKSIPGG